MTPDVDLTVLKPGRHALRDGLLAFDQRLFAYAAARKWPGAERVLPRLSRSANHGVLWCAVAAGLAVSGTPRGRRAAARGLAALSLASLTINTVGKRSVRRTRPELDPVPAVRRLRRQPFTTSFPSGHAASAAAFAAGVALESPAWGAVVAPVAFSVAASRVYTGVHFPSDVLAGAALGVGAALVVRAVLPERERDHDEDRAPDRDRNTGTETETETETETNTDLGGGRGSGEGRGPDRNAVGPDAVGPDRT